MSRPSSTPLSVIVISYNYERYVGEAIASALEQDGPPIEVIVVDDGSTDGSRRVIESFGDRLTAIFKANAGQAAAQNSGYGASAGEAVIFLDSDDLLLPSAADSVVAALREPSVAKVHWSMPIIDAEGRRTGELQDPVLAEGDLRRRFFEEGPLSDGTMPSPPSSGNAYARWFLDEVMPIPESRLLPLPRRVPVRARPRVRSDRADRAAVALPDPWRQHHLLRPFEKKLSFQSEHWETIARLGRDGGAAPRAGAR